MNTSFHFASAQEITPTILDTIKSVYQERSISIYIQEEPFIPEWQKQEVRCRDVIMENNLEDHLLDCDAVISELEKELDVL